MGTEADSLNGATFESEAVEIVEEVENIEQEQQDIETNEVNDDAEQEDESTVDSDEDTPPQDKQQDNNAWIQKRLSRKDRKIEAVTGESDKYKEELALERERNKLLQLAIEQGKSSKAMPDTEPDPDTFDEGEYDAEYKKQLKTYQEKRTRELVAASIKEDREASARNQSEEQKAKDLESKQIAHYERALKLGIANYDTVEDSVIDVLGEDNVNHIIQNLDNSEVVMCNLWENKDATKKIAALLKTNPIQALVEIGRLSGTKLKSKANPAPNPVDPLEGSNSFSKRKMLVGAKFE